MIDVRVQTGDFDVAAEYKAMIDGNRVDGGVVMFVGRVRESNLARAVNQLQIEHYPAMVEKVLHDIAGQAAQRWRLSRVRIIHRVGSLNVTDQIVLVAVSSEHRDAAFAAARFIMDFLKTAAPFWKKEISADGVARWLEPKAEDAEAVRSWQD